MPRAAPRVKALVAASRKSGEAASARGKGGGMVTQPLRAPCPTPSF